MAKINEGVSARPVIRVPAPRRSPIEAVASGRTLAPIARRAAPERRTWRVADRPATWAAERRSFLASLLRRLRGAREAA